MKNRSEPVTAAIALVKMQQYCAFRERSEKEVVDKLYLLGLPAADQQSVLKSLREEGFLNDNRFAGAYAGGKFRTRKWGRIKIKAMLSGSRVSESAIREALDQIPEADYLKELEMLMVKKLSSINETDPIKRKHKLVRFALGKGYESELVWKMAGKLVNTDGHTLGPE
jgi:regulatory protein